MCERMCGKPGIQNLNMLHGTLTQQIYQNVEMHGFVLDSHYHY